MNFLLKNFRLWIPIISICIGLLRLNLLMGYSMEPELSIQSKMLNSSVAKIGRELEKKYKMRQAGIGGGARPDGIWLMALSFERIGDPLSEEEARKLIIQCVDDFLYAVNSNKELRSFLRDYPFMPKNLSLTILNYDKKGVLCFFPFIAIVKNSEGDVGFLTKKISQEYGYHTKKYETYDEAVAILKNEK